MNKITSFIQQNQSKLVICLIALIIITIILSFIKHFIKVVLAIVVIVVALVSLKVVDGNKVKSVITKSIEYSNATIAKLQQRIDSGNDNIKLYNANGQLSVSLKIGDNWYSLDDITGVYENNGSMEVQIGETVLDINDKETVNTLKDIIK